MDRQQLIIGAVLGVVLFYVIPKVWGTTDASPAEQCEGAKREVRSEYNDAIVRYRKLDAESSSVTAAFTHVSMLSDPSDPATYRILANMDLSDAPTEVRKAVHETKEAARKAVAECGY